MFEKLAALFTPSGDTIKGAMEGAGSLAVDLRTAIKGAELDPNKRAELESKVLEIESKVKQAQAGVIIAEAQGDSWLQRSWRPITMLIFVAIILVNQFGIFPIALSPEIWGVLKIGIGGYVVGRSAEKVAIKWNQK